MAFSRIKSGIMGSPLIMGLSEKNGPIMLIMAALVIDDLVMTSLSHDDVIYGVIGIH